MGDEIRRLKKLIAEHKRRKRGIEARKAEAMAKFQAELDTEDQTIAELESAIRGHETYENVIKKFLLSDAIGFREGLQLEHVKGPEASRSDESESMEPRQSASDLADTSVAEAALRVLEDAEDDRWWHYTEVAERAIARGYRGRKAGNDVEASAKAFLDVMRRQPDRYARRDFEYFRHPRYGPGERPRHRGIFGPSEETTRADLAEELLKETRRPMTPKAMALILIERGFKDYTSLKGLRGSLINAMYRSEKFEQVGDGTWRLKAPTKSRGRPPKRDNVKRAGETQAPPAR